MLGRKPAGWSAKKSAMRGAEATLTTGGSRFVARAVTLMRADKISLAFVLGRLNPASRPG